MQFFVGGVKATNELIYILYLKQITSMYHYNERE